LTYGPRAIKRGVWDKEYRDNKWDFADNTMGDCVYPHLEKHAKNGSILDMGCGSGNTATELAESAYHSYVGVDISAVALAKAMKRTRESGRQGKNSFACSDFLAYQPTETFDVILFRESIYHVPLGKVKDVLDHYSAYLKEGGVIMVRLFAGSLETSTSKYRPNAMLAIMEAEFDVVERTQYPDAGLPTVIVFRPKIAATTELSVENQRLRKTSQAVSQ